MKWPFVLLIKTYSFVVFTLPLPTRLTEVSIILGCTHGATFMKSHVCDVAWYVPTIRHNLTNL